MGSTVSVRQAAAPKARWLSIRFLVSVARENAMLRIDGML